LCFGHDSDGDNHGVRRADTAQAHTQWQHLVALHEATNTLYRVTCLAPYYPDGMVAAIAGKSVTL
jgi:hypothetical protein